MPRSLLLLAFLLISRLVSLAPAAVTVYTDRAAFEAAIGPHAIYTFEANQGFATAPADVKTFGPVTASTAGYATTPGEVPPPNGPAVIRVVRPGTPDQTQTLSGRWHSPDGTTEFTEPMLLSFEVPQYVVGLDTYTGSATSSVSVVSYFSSVDGLHPQAYELLGNPAFLGILSTDPIANIHIRSIGDSRSNLYMGIDNLLIVPEPGSIMAIVSSLLLIGRRCLPKSAGEESRKRRKNGDAHSFIALGQPARHRGGKTGTHIVSSLLASLHGTVALSLSSRRTTG